METKENKLNAKRIAFIAIAFVIAFAVYYPFSPAGIQRRNLRLADKYAKEIEKALATSSSFSDIRLGPYTGDGGMLWIMGHVRSKNDLKQLETVIEKHDLKIPVKWSVYVLVEE